MDFLQVVEKTQTSRNIILDQVEFITNQIALVSHLIELYVDKSVLATETGNEKVKLEADEILVELISATKLRRDMMTELAKAYPNNNHYWWCSLKHCIASYGFMTEILLAEPDNQAYQSMIVQANKQMISIISRYLDIELTTCARCLSDMLN